MTQTEKKYRVQDKQTGTVIESGITFDHANELVETFESADKTDGIFEPDFYEIVEMEGGQE